MKGFFLVSGIVLVISGVLQVFVRPRIEGESRLAGLLHRATIRAVVFVLAGALAVLVGSGWVSLPSAP